MYLICLSLIYARCSRPRCPVNHACMHAMRGTEGARRAGTGAAPTRHGDGAQHPGADRAQRTGLPTRWCPLHSVCRICLVCLPSACLIYLPYMSALGVVECSAPAATLPYMSVSASCTLRPAPPCLNAPASHRPEPPRLIARCPRFHISSLAARLPSRPAPHGAHLKHNRARPL